MDRIEVEVVSSQGDNLPIRKVSEAVWWVRASGVMGVHEGTDVYKSHSRFIIGNKMSVNNCLLSEAVYVSNTPLNLWR